MERLKSKHVIEGLLAGINQKSRKLKQPVRIMEVCGTHTMAMHRHGLKKLLSRAGIEMLSGPGCPVCITPNAIHEAAIQLVMDHSDLILTTFGDMTRVPTERGSLQTIVPAAGSHVKLVYSPEESLDIAKKNPNKEIVFFGVGFETTIPGIAYTIRQAGIDRISNFSVLTALRIVPPPLKAIAAAEGIQIQGFLYPGHVSAIIGEAPYRFLAEDYHIPGAITGFEPADILLGVNSILDQMLTGRPIVANQYARVVRKQGNPTALALIEEILRICDSDWRGLGRIPQSGLCIRPEFEMYDAEKKYRLDIQCERDDLPGCRCGEVLQGKISPPECPLFGKQCRPDNPHGPCMVSYEGACLAHYKYREID